MILKFNCVEDYLNHWDKFFNIWIEGKSNQKKLLKSDKIWSKHKGKEWENNKGKKCSTKLEPHVFPQPYLGNINNYSVITLNLNPSRSKNEEYIEFEKKNLPKFKEVKSYYKYAESFSTYDTHPFWEVQKNWINRIFENFFKEKLSKDSEPTKPFAIEICPWGSKSWLGLGIKTESKKLKNLEISANLFLKYLNNFVFNVIEKAIQNSKLKMVLSVGKEYYDIFQHKQSGFQKIIECTKWQNSKAWDLKLYKDEEIKAELNKAFFENVWPKKEENNENLRYVNRSFSFWKKNGVVYFNSWAPSSNKPPGKNFKEVEEEFFRIYKLYLTK